MAGKPFLRPEEVAELLDISENTIRHWLRKGELPGVKFGRQWRIRKDDLDKFIEQHYRTKDRTDDRQADS